MFFRKFSGALLLSCFFFSGGCRKQNATLFDRLSANKTSIDFNNKLKEDNPEFSILNYPYFYNGGGVGVGDINNDGLDDVFFTGNMVGNKLYLNKGDFKFEDISLSSGIAEIAVSYTHLTLPTNREV